MRATKLITVEEGQTIYDIALQYYGNVKAVSLLLTDNNLGFDSVLSRGQTLIIQNMSIPNPDDVLQGGIFQDTAVQRQYAKEDTRINTGDFWQQESAFSYGFTFGFEA